MRLALCGVPLIVVALWSGSARAQDQALQVEKVTQLNKEALADVDRADWYGAKKKLLDAIMLAKKAGLDGHPLMARTYVHLGIVYVMGLKSLDKGMQSFNRALEIQPDIKLSPGITTTTEVQETFDEAAARLRRGLLPRAAVPRGGFAEPDLPVRVIALDCPVAEQTRLDQAVPVRCALAPNLPVSKVFLFYREPAKQRFTEVEMNRTPKGWFLGRIPERVVYGQSVQFYFEGRNAAGRPIVRNGDPQSPNLIPVLKR